MVGIQVEKRVVVCDRNNEKISRKFKLQQGMEKLYGLIGLTSVKEKILELSHYLRVENQARMFGITKMNQPSWHFVFVGNPGTGKTEVARIFTDILYGIGVTRSTYFLETNRSNLVGAYIGHTEKNVKEVLEAVVEHGGVLFIDEFHQLYNESERDFGRVAISVLVSYIENYRNEFVTIIAGYPKEMNQAIASDPGLQSRFGFYIEFPDYTVKELIEIFYYFCKNNHRIIHPDKYQETQAILEKGFHSILDLGLKQIAGNARLVRKIYEKAELKQTNRIAKRLSSSVTFEEFIEAYAFLEPSDIEEAFDEVKKELESFSFNNRKIGFKS